MGGPDDTGKSLSPVLQLWCKCWLPTASNAASTLSESMSLMLVVPSTSPSSPLHLPSPSPTFLPLTLGAITSSLLSTCLKTITWLTISSTLTGVFHGMYRSLSPMLTHFHQLACLDISVSNGLGEFCILRQIWCILTFSISFTAICASFPMLCVSLCSLNLTMQCPILFGLSGHCLAASTGEFGVFEPFWHMLTLSISFSAVFTLSAMLCASMHTIDTSIGFPKVFGPSGHCLAALIGESGGLVFFWGVLTFSGEFVGFIMSISTLGMSPVPAWWVCLAPKAIHLNSAMFQVSNTQVCPCTFTTAHLDRFQSV